MSKAITYIHAALYKLTYNLQTHAHDDDNDIYHSPYMHTTMITTFIPIVTSRRCHHNITLFLTTQTKNTTLQPQCQYQRQPHLYLTSASALPLSSSMPGSTSASASAQASASASTSTSASASASSSLASTS